MADLQTTSITSSLDVVGTVTGDILKNTINSPNYAMMGDGSSKTIEALFNNNIFLLLKVELGISTNVNIKAKPLYSDIVVNTVVDVTNGYTTYTITFNNIKSYTSIDFRKCFIKLDSCFTVRGLANRKLYTFLDNYYVKVIYDNTLEIRVKDGCILNVYNYVPIMFAWHSFLDVTNFITSIEKQYSAKYSTPIAKINNLHSDIIPTTDIKDIFLAKSNQDNKWYEVSDIFTYNKGALANGYYVADIYWSITFNYRTTKVDYYVNGILTNTTTYTVYVKWYSEINYIKGFVPATYWLPNKSKQTSDFVSSGGSCGSNDTTKAIGLNTTDNKWYVVNLADDSKGAILNGNYGYVVTGVSSSEIDFACYATNISQYINGVFQEERMYYLPEEGDTTLPPSTWTDWAEKKLTDCTTITYSQYIDRVSNNIMPTLTPGKSPTNNTYGLDKANGGVYTWTLGQNPGLSLSNGYWGANWFINDNGQYQADVIFSIVAGTVEDYLYYEFYKESATNMGAGGPI